MKMCAGCGYIMREVATSVTRTVLNVANRATTDNAKNAFCPSAVCATNAKGAEDADKACQPTTETAMTETATYKIVEIIIDRMSARGINFVGFFVSPDRRTISSKPRKAKNISAAPLSTPGRPRCENSK